MKNIFQKTLILLCGLSIVSACGDKLNVEPQQSISADLALSNTDNIATVVKGLYSQLQQGRLYGSYLNMYGELLAEPASNEVAFSGTFADLRQLWQKNQVANNATASVTWREAYQTIRMANSVIDNASKIDQTSRASLTGEAQLIRGMMYFELVRFYAKPWEINGSNTHLGVPLMLKAAPIYSADITPDEYPARASITAVYDQIIKDLEAAKAALPNTRPSRWAASRHVAAAVLARVYLQQGKYAQAAAEAHSVIASGRFALVDDVAAVYNQASNTTEDILAIQQTAQSEAVDGDCVNFYASTVGVGRGDMDIRNGHLALYQTTDERRTKLFYTGTGRKAGRVRSGKWRTQYSNIPVIRLAEMYLIRAEGNLRSNGSLGDTPLNDINRIRTRAKATPLAAVTIADVLMERRLELAWEGHRLHDIKRTQGTVGTRPYTDPKLVLPIPQREIDANKALVQNEGY